MEKTSLLQGGFWLTKKVCTEAYELLLSDALRGDSTYFAHWKEVELSWNWAEPILEEFEGEIIFRLHLYPFRFHGTRSI